MIEALPTDIQDRLRRSAAEMRRGQRSIPVMLRDICASLRIAVKRQPIVPSGKAFLAWNREREPAPTILLPVQPHKTWDRFCAAHELGHFVLISEYAWIPQQREDYWKTEDLCDDFARELLLPLELFSNQNDNEVSPATYLDLCDRVSRSALVPWKQVASKITDLNPVFFLVFDNVAAPHLKVTASTLPRGQGRVDIPSDTLLAKRVQQAYASAKEHGESVDIRISRSTFRGTKLESIIRKMTIDNFLLRVSGRSAQARIAATS